MKTIIKSFALLTMTMLLSLNMLATGFEFEPEQYIDDIPFNLETIEEQIVHNKALLVDFSMSEEEYIDDIPFTENYLTKLYIYANAVSQEFNFEDEESIADLPAFSTSEEDHNAVNFITKANCNR